MKLPCTSFNEKGFTLFEVLLALVILGIAIAPMIQAFGPAISSIVQKEEITAFNYQARATLSRVATLDFDTLNNNQGNPVDLAALFVSPEEATKESFSFRGQTYTPVVAINDASGGAGDLLLLSVAVENINLTMLKANY